MEQTAIFTRPDELKAISDRFSKHHQEIEAITASVLADMELMFPYYSGPFPDKKILEETVCLLQKSSKILYDYARIIPTVIEKIPMTMTAPPFLSPLTKELMNE